MHIINPATEELICDIIEDTAASVATKFQLLRSTQAVWKNQTLAERISVMQAFSGLLEQHVKQLSGVLTSEVGKPLRQSVNEINGAIKRINWMTENAEKYLRDEVMTQGNGLVEKISYEPLGVIANISAWNYPYLVGVNVFVPALIAGNTVMYKPSEHATLTGIEIEKLLKKAGLPENVFHIAVGEGRAGEYLTDLPFDGYFFTGSYKTGKTIYEKVAHRMVPCHCELGGKDPLYVADDIADIRSVAAATADGAFYNNGQSCCAVERIYVHEKIYDQYLEAFNREVKSWKMGPPTGDNVYLGPLTRKGQPAFLEEQVKEAVEKGAVILTGGHRVGGKGYYFEPTVLANVTHEMKVMTEESFGPVIGIMKVASDYEAVQLMKDTEYGLTAAVYSSNKKRAEKILSDIDTGTGYWNCCDRVSAPLPWTGRNHSGVGVTLSHAGLRAFTKTKAYHLLEPQ